MSFFDVIFDLIFDIMAFLESEWQPLQMFKSFLESISNDTLLSVADRVFPRFLIPVSQNSARIYQGIHLEI